MKVEVDVIRPAPPSAGDARRKKWFWFGIASVVSTPFFASLIVGQDEARRARACKEAEEAARRSPPSSTRPCAKPAAPVLRTPIAGGHPFSCIGR